MTTVPVMRSQLPRAERLLPYLQRIDANRIYSNHGPLLGELQERLSRMFGVADGMVVAAGNGTEAIVGALLARCGRARKPRAYVLMPAFTFVATAIAAEQCGYQPYLLDVGEESWTLDPGSLVEHPALESAAAVVPVAPFGGVVPAEPWLWFQQRTGVPVVIDAAAAFDTVSAAPDSSVGEIPLCFSFHATKVFSTSEGGAVVVNDTELAQAVTQSLNFGFRTTRNSSTASINGKMSEYHAAVGLAELDGWPEKLAALQSVARRYRHAAAEAGIAKGLFSWPEISACYVLYQSRDAGESGRIGHALREAGIDFRFWYGGGVHRQSYFETAPRTALPVTELLGKTLIGLPVAPDLEEGSIARIVSVLSRARSAFS